jgi:hypothetical protein
LPNPARKNSRHPAQIRFHDLPESLYFRAGVAAMTRLARGPRIGKPFIRRLEIETLESRVVPSTGTHWPFLASSGCGRLLPKPDLNASVVLGNPTGGSSSGSIGQTFGLSSVPQLSSLPGAKASIYLNFTGDFTASWGGFSNITTPAYDIDGDPTTFTQTELNNITQIWQYVAEDYAPFNINVTTVQPTSMGHGVTQKIDIGGGGSWLGFVAGGVSYIGSFVSTWVPNISFVFSNNLGVGYPKYVGDASSHEAGHSFGLYHQSQYDASGKLIAEYYTGPGDGTAPIMGDSYYAPLSRWWMGPNDQGATDIQDDMAVISSATNGFGYRDDSVGNTMATARPLTANNGQVSNAGIIIKTSDTNFWSFTTGAGQITLNMNVAAGVNNLIAKLVLEDASGNVIATGDDNSATAYSAAISANVAAGTYYLVAESHGGYGDVGQYTLSGTIFPPAAPTGLTVTAGDTQVSLSWTATGGATSYNIYRSLTAGGEGTIPYKTGITTTSFTDTGLTDGTTYYYQVTGVNTGGESGKSSEASATPHTATTTLAIDAGGGAAGGFVADIDFGSGRTYSTTHSIDTSGVTNPAPQAVYQTERYGGFTYTIPNLTPGTSYTVRLHFAEIYWNAAGKRLFYVKVNGTQVLSNFDVFAVAGGEYKAIVESFTAVADANGNITIKFAGIVDSAIVSGIEILALSGAASLSGSQLRVGGIQGDLAGFLTSTPGATAGSTNSFAKPNKRPISLLASASFVSQKFLEQSLGDPFAWSPRHTSSAQADWTGDLLVQWQL